MYLIVIIPWTLLYHQWKGNETDRSGKKDGLNITEMIEPLHRKETEQVMKKL